MEYFIKYTYDSGDSFNHYHDLEGEIELSWKNYDVAVANLKRLEEHYKQYEALNSYSDKRSDKDIFKENKNKDWFVDNVKDRYFSEYTLRLYTDDGIEMRYSCPYCGYFETLNSLEIITKNPKINFK